MLAYPEDKAWLSSNLNVEVGGRRSGRARFDLLHSNTPKGGLLAAISGLFAGVPIRLHTFTGLPWDEVSPLGRWILRICYRLIISLNTQCYADSNSQRDLYMARGVKNADRIKVLGAGSVAGVDCQRFDPALYKDKKKLRADLSIPEDGKVIIFIGRLVKEKGILELRDAFDLLQRQGHTNVFLILVGRFKPEPNPLPQETIDNILSYKNIRYVGFSPTPEKYLAISDLICLPSYREGFGSVVIEAAAMGIPAVGTRVVGIVDAIVDRVTGILVPVKDVDSLANALATLLGNNKLRHKMGLEAQKRAKRLFDVNIFNSYILDEYNMLSKTYLCNCPTS